MPVSAGWYGGRPTVFDSSSRPRIEPSPASTNGRNPDPSQGPDRPGSRRRTRKRAAVGIGRIAGGTADPEMRIPSDRRRCCCRRFHRGHIVSVRSEAVLQGRRNDHVTGQATFLRPGSTYSYRIVVTNNDGIVPGAAASFATSPQLREPEPPIERPRHRRRHPPGHRVDAQARPAPGCSRAPLTPASGSRRGSRAPMDGCSKSSSTAIPCITRRSKGAAARRSPVTG